MFSQSLNSCACHFLWCIFSFFKIQNVFHKLSNSWVSCTCSFLWCVFSFSSFKNVFHKPSSSRLISFTCRFLWYFFSFFSDKIFPPHSLHFFYSWLYNANVTSLKSYFLWSFSVSPVFKKISTNLAVHGWYPVHVVLSGVSSVSSVTKYFPAFFAIFLFLIARHQIQM